MMNEWVEEWMSEWINTQTWRETESEGWLTSCASSHLSLFSSISKLLIDCTKFCEQNPMTEKHSGAFWVKTVFYLELSK